MAVNSKAIRHSRSKSSSPIKTHSFLSQFNKHLHRLQTSEGASTSQPSVSYKLDGLIDYLNFVDNTCQLMCTKQVVMQEQNRKLGESLLDESLWLIDVCETIRDVLVQTAEGTQQIQSILRRKQADGCEVGKEFASYFKSRKIVKKANLKFSKEADSCRKTVNLNLDSSDENQKKTNPYLCLLQKSHSTSADALKSLFSYIACSRKPSGISKWSLISKLMIQSKHKQLEEEGWSKKNNFEVVDDAMLLAC